MINIIDQVVYLHESDMFDRIYNDFAKKIIGDINIRLQMIDSSGYNVVITISGHVTQQYFEVETNFNVTGNPDLDSQIQKVL